MSKKTEKAINGLHRFLEEHGGVNSEEELQEMLNQYMTEYNNSLRFQPELSEANAETSEDWLELAEEAENPNDAVRFAKKSLSLDPNNYDAAVFLIDLENELPHIQLEHLNSLFEKATAHMEETGHIPQDVGDFWGVYGTRPYMRLLATKMHIEKESGMFLEAIRDGEEILRLNSHDNMGIRSSLMGLYALLLKEAEAEKLIEKYDRDGYIETSLFLPLSILHFRLGKLEKAKEILLQLNKANPDTKKFFRSAINGDLEPYFADMPEEGYRPNTMDEYLVTMQDEYYLLSQSRSYVMWADETLKHQTRSRTKTSKSRKKH